MRKVNRMKEKKVNKREKEKPILIVLWIQQGAMMIIQGCFKIIEFKKVQTTLVGQVKEMKMKQVSYSLFL